MSMISLNNGLSWLSAENAISEINERGLWDAVVVMMDNNIRERVHAELAPCSRLDFLHRYLELAPENLIFG